VRIGAAPCAAVPEIAPRATGVVEAWFEEPGINDAGEDDDPNTVTNPEVAPDYLKTRRAPKAA